MFVTARRDLSQRSNRRIDARVHNLLCLAKGQTGAISILTLVVILLAPLVVLGGLAFVLVLAYANRVSRITAESESKPKPTVCPACGHKLVEIRRFCAECGASIWRAEPETDQTRGPDGNPEEPQ